MATSSTAATGCRFNHYGERCRGLHRGLSKRLNRWLEQQAAGTAAQSDDEVIDEELGLSFGDFRSSLQVLKVERTATIDGPFLRTTLGRVRRSNEGAGYTTSGYRHGRA